MSKLVLINPYGSHMVIQGVRHFVEDNKTTTYINVDYIVSIDILSDMYSRVSTIKGEYYIGYKDTKLLMEVV